MDEDQLRQRIRSLLLNYALEHFTTDYIALTAQAVSDLCHYEQIPTVDPNALTLPPDPFDTLTRVYGLTALPPFQEKFQSTPNAIQYIKKTLGPNPRKPPSTSAAFEEHPSEARTLSYVPISSILSARARRETPRPGTNTFLRSLPNSHWQFLASQGITSVADEPMVEELVKQDEVLNVSWKLRQDQREAVRATLLNVLAPPKEYKNPHLDFSSRPDTPPPPQHEPFFIPIFPRRRRLGDGSRPGQSHPSGLSSMQDVAGVILPPVKVEEIEPELYKQNMVVIDGWSALRSSPSPTPSPNSSHEDQIDELWPSPDTSPLPVRPTKMDVVQIPRTKRIGGQRKKPDPIGHGSSLGAFLVPHMRECLELPSRRSPEPCDSLVGQAASTVQEELDEEITALYGERKDPADWILKEKVDEKRQLLMEVPNLPPPTQHGPNGLFLPTELRDLLASREQTAAPPKRFCQVLKKAKGTTAVNVELRWHPIPPQTRIPTHTQVLRVDHLLDEHAPVSASAIEALLAATGSPNASGEDAWTSRYSKYCFEASVGLELDPRRSELVLSRRDRRRAAGLPLDHAELVSTPPKDAEEHDRSPKRVRLRSHPPYFDDSGIALEFAEPNVHHLSMPRSSQTLDSSSWPQDIAMEPSPMPEADFGDYEYEKYDAHRLQMYEDAQDDSQQFQALSFDSAPQQLTQPRHDALSDETYANMFEPHRSAIVNDTAVSALPPDIATHSLGIFEFARLRAKKISAPVAPAPAEVVTAVPVEAIPPTNNTLPDEMYDRNTVTLPSTWDPPVSQHRYLVSIDVVQKQGLVRSLRSQMCCVELAERESMTSVDMILDPHSAVIFANLLTLPSEGRELVQRLASESWRYSRIFVVFEAYPAAHAFQSASTSRRSELSAYTPPVLKALRKFRRDLEIMEGAGTKSKDCVVQHGFADTVDEAAQFVRYFGNFVEAIDESGGALWGDRSWLEGDIPEGEGDLAAADGMNLFASFVILCQIGLEQFLELTSEERTAQFATFVGATRMNLLNEVIGRRLAAMQPSDSEMY
uniref:Proteophosphoglycan 5 n=1 Tax=Mycena chlorophos TaxID=658473 RepID=A0ABQ0M9Q6_MYCCL|nr:predicted protein [Mycena chlorophos]